MTRLEAMHDGFVALRGKFGTIAYIGFFGLSITAAVIIVRSDKVNMESLDDDIGNLKLGLLSIQQSAKSMQHMIIQQETRIQKLDLDEDIANLKSGPSSIQQIKSMQNMIVQQGTQIRKLIDASASIGRNLITEVELGVDTGDLILRRYSNTPLVSHTDLHNVINGIIVDGPVLKTELLDKANISDAYDMYTREQINNEKVSASNAHSKTSTYTRRQIDDKSKKKANVSDITVSLSGHHVHCCAIKHILSKWTVVDATCRSQIIPEWDPVGEPTQSSRLSLCVNLRLSMGTAQWRHKLE